MSARLIDDLIDRVAQRVTVILVSVMIAVVGLNVFCRYILGFSWAWGEELPRYALVWIAFIGGTVAVKRGEMMVISFLVDKLPATRKRLVMAIAYSSSCIFLITVVVYGVFLSAATYKQLSPALRFPMTYAYAVIPISCSIMLFHILIQLVDLIRRGTKADIP
jgi:TRAP-type C4-dicarboxylate transport system permease small subunit